MKDIISIDLHGVSHEDAEDTLEKFITDHFEEFPLKVITGNSEYQRCFMEDVQKVFTRGISRSPTQSCLFYNSFI